MRTGRSLVIGALLVAAGTLVTATGISSSTTLAAPAARRSPIGGSGGSDGSGGSGPGTTALPTRSAPSPRPMVWEPAARRADKPAAAARIATEARRSPSTRLRLVTLADVGGRPVVSAVTVAGDAAAQAAKKAAADPAVLALGTDARYSALATTNDPYRSSQWALDALGADVVNARHDATGVTVAVVDSGVQRTHPDLAGAVLPGTDFVSAGGDGSADGAGHGTHVAGIVAAVAGNGIGVAGMAHGARVLPVRVLDDTGSGWTSWIASGIVWAADHGARVVNLSLGGPSADPVLESAVNYATSKGALVVAAAGNDRAKGSPTSYPAAYANVLAVAATDSTGASGSFSNLSPYVRIAAPGVSILSTWKGSGYASASGTSMATPYVSAAAALLAASAPSLTPAQLATALTATAVDKGAPGRDPEFGHGLVNPAAALCSVGVCGTGPAPSTSTTTAPTTSPTTAPTTSTTTSPTTSTSTTATTTSKVSTTTAPTTPGTTSSTTRSTTTTAPPVKAAVTLTLRPLPTGLRFGDTFSISATASAAGRPLAGLAAQVCTRRVNGVSCAAATSNATGVLTWSSTASGSGTVTVTSAETTTALAATSAPLTLTVQSVLTPSVPARGSAQLSVQPLLGQTVSLERQSGSSWTAVVTRALPDTGGAGRGSITVSGLPAGVYRWRVTTSSGLLAETITTPSTVSSTR